LAFTSDLFTPTTNPSNITLIPLLFKAKTDLLQTVQHIQTFAQILQRPIGNISTPIHWYKNPLLTLNLFTQKNPDPAFLDIPFSQALQLYYWSLHLWYPHIYKVEIKPHFPIKNTQKNQKQDFQESSVSSWLDWHRAFHYLLFVDI